jgi:hypothetical protein
MNERQNMDQIKDSLKNRFNRIKEQTVNSKAKSLYTVNGNNNSIDTVNSDETVNSMSLDEKLEELFKDAGMDPDGQAIYLAEKLDDTKSTGYYSLLIKNNNVTRLFDALHITIEASREGKIRSKKAVYFQGILRMWRLKTKFAN